MHPILVAEPAVEPIALADMKRYLRIDGDDEDEVVATLVAAGRLTVERATRLALVEQTWRVRLAAWPHGRAVRLPVFPVLSVEAVRVHAMSGGPTSLAPDLYRLDLSCDPARLLVDAAAPESGRDGIEIDVLCGFGATGAAVPEPLRLAIRRLVAWWFEHRGDDAPGAPGLPDDVRALIASFARPRLA